jgi:signal transduction histidine kinase
VATPARGTAPQPDDGALILIADDIPANVELLFDQLRSLGYRTVTAHDGPSALAACFAHRPQLCILDVAMPAGDLGCGDHSTGYEVCRRIKKDPRTARIPVVFVTALTESTDRLHAIEAGGDDYLTKPYNRLVLGARITSLLKLKAATDALEDSYRKLRELQKVRDDLLKMIVHDLKTPLTGILATLEMLLDGDYGAVGDPQRQVLTDAEGKADDLLQLIEDLLEVARLEEAALPIVREPISPAAFLEEIAHEWSVRLQQERATVIVEVSDDAPVFRADKGLLRRVLGNLVQNALTHSSHAITLRLGARRDGRGILLTVADTGPGIPREYHDIIFGKFQQMRTAAAPRVRSSGLGLTFCRLVVEQHGGRIWVRSAEGEGSSFHILLPIEEGSAVPFESRLTPTSSGAWAIRLDP